MTLKYWLDKKNIPYVIKDLDIDPDAAEEAFKLSGYIAVPVTHVKGRGTVVGPNFPRLIALLA